MEFTVLMPEKNYKMQLIIALHIIQKFIWNKTWYCAQSQFYFYAFWDMCEVLEKMQFLCTIMENRPFFNKKKGVTVIPTLYFSVIKLKRFW